MADIINKIGADVSQFNAAIDQVNAALGKHNTTIDAVAQKYVQLNKNNEITKAGLRVTQSDLSKMDVELRKTAEGWTILVKKVTEAGKSLKEFENQQKRVAATQGAQMTLNAFGFGDLKNMPAAILGEIRKAQQELQRALGSGAGFDQIQQMLQRLRQGQVDLFQPGTGLDKAQQALLRLLALEQRITAEKEKQGRIAAQVDRVQLAAFEKRLTTALPVPAGGSASSLLSYQAALNRVIQIASTGKVPLQDLNKLFTQLAAKPFGQSFATATPAIQQAASAIQRLIVAQQTATRSAEQMGEAQRRAGAGALLSFQALLRVLEIQVIHRAFGALITGMQNSITTAADLQISISGIRTIAQESGISFTEFQQIIRQTSEAFGRSQVDVATALYEGFSNQVIKTREDLVLLNEVMRLSRITISTTADSMSLLSSALNAYRRPAEEARIFSDQLFRAIDIGRFRASDIANTLGRVAVTAREVGIEFNELMGMMANLTRAGVTPSEAMTQISSIMQSLMRPSEDLKNLFREWGVESGIQAVRTMGFVGVLRRLFEESQRGAGRLGELIHNVRALRGVLGATGGGLEELERDIAQIGAAGPQADRAFEIMAESAGDKFRKEMIKVQNFFINDFANGLLESISKLTAPFGGFANLIKDVAKAVLSVVDVVMRVAGVFASLLQVLSPLGINLTTMIQLWVLYKTTMALINTAVGIYVGIIALKARLTAADTASTAANMTALMGQAAAQTVATAATARATTVTIAGLVAAKAKTIAVMAMAGAWRFFAAALTSIPFIGILMGIAIAIGAIKARIDAANAAIQSAIDRNKQFGEQLNDLLNRNAERERQIANERSQAFQQDLSTNTRIVQEGLRRITLMVNELVDAQKRVVEATTAAMNQSWENVKSNLDRILNAAKQNVRDAERAIEESLRRVGQFADREFGSLFRRQMEAAGTMPTRANVSSLTPQQEIDRAQDIADADRARGNQLVLIQGRVAQLQREADDFVRRGDRESMERARRRYEEIRRLTEQQWSIENDRRRAALQASLEDAARRTGVSQRGTLTVDPNELERRLEEVRRLEEASEARFREAQERARQQAEAAVAEAERRRQAALDAFRAIQEFRITNDEGRLLPGMTMERMRERFAQLAAALRTAMAQGNIDPATQVAMMTAVENQRVALFQQAQREMLRAELSRITQATQAERERIQRMRDEAQRDITAAGGRSDTTLRDLNTYIGNLAQDIQRNGTNAQKEAFARIMRQVEAAIQGVATARGTPGEAGAIATLQARLAEVQRIYAEFIRSTVGTGALPEGVASRLGETGAERIATITAALQGVTPALTANAEAIRQGNLALAEADRLSAAMATNFRALPPAIQDAMLQAEIAGRGIAAGMEPAITAIRRLGTEIAAAVRQLNELRGGAAGAAIPGRAEGGMIGSFNSTGPDNTIIRARTGEFVVNPDATRRFYTQLVAINSGRLPRFADGGVVGGTTIGDVNITVNESSTPDSTARAVMSRFRRETRRGSGRI